MSPLSRRTRLRALLIFSFVMLIAFGWISSQHASSGAGPINPPSQVAAEKSIINPEATIVVNSLADTASPTDGLCTLREAMTAANNNAASGAVAGECVAGGAGTDVIDMSGLTGTISLTSQPPSITSDMSITGPPSRLITITRSSVSSFRILTVGSGVLATISNLAITNGDAPTGGGGIFNLGTLTVTNCDVSGNTASSSSFGGGINNQGTLRIVGSLISNNTSVFGAGIYNHTNTLIMQNSTVSGNHDQGIIVNGNAWLINCTITANDGVGVGNSGTTHLRNTIIAGNNGSVDVTSFFASDGNNLIGKSDGTNNLTNGVNGDKVGSTGSPLNPQLASLADNGGPTKTHALLSNSPAIDSGNDCVTQAAHCGDVNVAQMTTDQRGSARNLDGDANGTATTDIGAYEFGGILVNNTNDSGAGSLRQAVADANASATPLTIVFSIPSTDSGCSGGVCTITLTSGELLLSQNMAIQGPGTGLLTISGNNSSRVFNIQSGKTASMSDLTITKGNVAVVAGGGGILNNGTLALTNINFYGNVSSFPGGAIYNNGTSLTLTNCNLGGTGVGQANQGSSGSGIYNNTGTLNMTGGTIAGNSGGPAAVTNNGTVTFTSVSMNNNTSNNSGALLTNDGATTVTGCLIANNMGSNGAGIGVFGLGSANIKNSTISGNISSTHGGGIFVNFNSNVTLTNVTVTNNQSFNTGGGIFLQSPSVGTLRNTIVAGNVFAGGIGIPQDDITGNVSVSSSFNLIGTGGSGGLSNGVNNNQVGVANPGLGVLANNGGPTKTHALLAGSPAFDAGDNTLASNAGLTTDQRGSGFARSVDGPDADGTATVDIGAYEAQISLEDIQNKTTNEDTPLSFQFNIGGAAANVTATSDNTALLPNNVANLSVTGSGSTRTLSITPLANQFGTANITVTVDNGSGQTATDSFVLTVNSVNDVPSFAKGANQTVNEDAAGQTVAGWATSISAGPSNESGQTLSFVVGNDNIALFSTQPAVSPNGTLTYTPAANANGLAMVSVSIKDNGGTANGGVDTSAPQTFVITVNAVNDAPSFTKGASPIVNEDAGAQTVNNWATNISAGPADEVGQALTFQVTGNTNLALFSAGPAISPTGTLTYTLAANANGQATITINLKDDGGTGSGGVDTSASQTFFINVNAVNDAPSFTKGADQTVNNNAGAQSVANWATNISPGPTSESAQTVTFQVTGNTNTSLFSVAPTVSSSGTLTYTPSASAGGVATITIVATDNGGTTNGGVDTSAPQTFTITVTPAGGFVNFASSTGNTTENSGSVTVNVVRTGNTSQAVTVNYATNADTGVPCSTANGVASPKCDFTAARGSLSFGPGETSKPITVLLSQDSFVEGPESITLTLSNPGGNAALGTPSSMTVTIADDATEPSTNIIDDPNMFVRMHYHDFLNREGDQAGIDFWTGQMSNCGSPDPLVCKVNVSGAFFLSIEFQQTGYLVERIYKTAYGDATGTSTIGGSHQIFVPVVRANEFLTDTQRIGRGVVVLQPGWEQALESNKQAYALEFVQTSRFIAAFPTSMTPAQFVDKLNQNAGNILSQNERTTAINLFGNAANTTNVTARSQALRQVAEDQDLYNAELNRAFVLSEYIGYLRRNPNDAPESSLDYTGYEFWLNKLNQANGDYIKAEMVKAFISSSEYRQRFGP